jgi:hypothetical protein
MWDQFQLTIDPSIHIDDSLLSTFGELALILKDLLKLRDVKFATEDFKAKLYALQNRLHAVENAKVENVLMPPNATTIPAGQAVVSSMLNRCYRLTHLLTQGFEDAESHTIEDINFSLLTLLTSFKSGY